MQEDESLHLSPFSPAGSACDSTNNSISNSNNGNGRKQNRKENYIRELSQLRYKYMYVSHSTCNAQKIVRVILLLKIQLLHILYDFI